MSTLYFLFTLLLSLFFRGGVVQAQENENARKPNFVIIISDDQVIGDIDLAMPFTKSRLFGEGATFEQAFVTTPWCCPSRSSIFTGTYAHKHGVRHNGLPLLEDTIFKRLHDAGYFTGITGKYLNSSNGRPQNEFDFWRVTPFGNVNWLRPRFVDDFGIRRQLNEHVMSSTRRFTRSFFRNYDEPENRTKPFVLALTPIAPHRPAIPEAKYADRFSSVAPFRPDNFGCGTRAGKPTWVRRRRCPGKRQIAKFDEFRRKQLRSLLSLDDLVKLVFTELEKRSLLDSTMIFFISDNGLLRGDFGLYDKPFPYERAVHVPFGVRYPGIFSEGTRYRELVANIDIPATIYELSGVAPERDIDGVPLTTLVSSPGSWRTQLLLEGFGAEDGGDQGRKSFVSMMDPSLQIILNRDDIVEIYDRVNDPLQMVNLYQTTDTTVLERARALYRSAVALRPEVAEGEWLPEEVKELLSE